MLQDLLSGNLGLMGFGVLAFSLLMSITCHEFAHAWTAAKLGDPTPRATGRLTLNPLAHLDPLGTLMIFVFRFGWGKPVVTDPRHFLSPLRDSALVSLAGPVSNLLLASLLSLIMKLGLMSPLLLWPAIALNVGLAIFNLLPIYPLDGFRVVSGLLPLSLAVTWESLSGYGFWFLIFFVFNPFLPVTLLDLFVVPVSETILDFLLKPPIKFI